MVVEKKGWCVFDLEAHEFFVSRDVVFSETKFPYCEPTTTLVTSIDNSPSAAAYDDPLTHHSPSPLDLSNSLESGSENIASPQVATTSNRETVLDSNHPHDLTHLPSPTTQSSSSDPRWCDAIAKKIVALESNGTWTIEDLPPGKHAIGCKWVYKIKYNSDGTIERFKVRLVILGNNQVEGIDFNETFAPVAKMVSVHTFLAVVVARGWALHQMDVHNAFLHSDLDEEVYMQLPPGFSISTPGKICRLWKSLYSLRQAPRNWFAKLAGALKSFGFQQSYADYSLFTYERQDVSLYVLIYVDDLIIAGHRPNGTTVQQLDHALDGGHEINCPGLGLERSKSRTSRMGIESPVETCTKSRIHWMSAIFHQRQTWIVYVLLVGRID
ncbi:UNVERIFIED_CONTAM: Retrovirus-related Pol polyprotein from transposon RE1 [Sesamum latifolium]|uniref:Retrovirus-related Pol polyprotein from transposon RE1 n=1 Tax=Sesamum latifolium TaxID=2727402 RepID=A0AAW2U3E8_9LAMI